MVISMMKQDLKAVRIARRIQGSERRWLQRISARQWLPFRAILLQQLRQPSTAEKTVAVMKKKIGIDPAVGFLICIEGPHRGTDFRLISGRNFIGRAAAMDVSLPDDDTVSRESHALVTYDAKHNAFSLSSGQGRGITYCNDEQVEMVHPLKAYDIIEVGKSRLLFLPLCSQQFQWSEE